mmetsp:Transcript_14786/g.26066  ORF Transcript_14786/g.26066 Transcript_14786/m.26066 type:complete len:92 (+) Transcript_14786:780-1055(+)
MDSISVRRSVFFLTPPPLLRLTPTLTLTLSLTLSLSLPSSSNARGVEENAASPSAAFFIALCNPDVSHVDQVTLYPHSRTSFIWISIWISI